MNQILIAEKLYVTPELRRKKRLFKIEFFLSVFLVCILSSYYIYAEYDRGRSEQISQELLAEVQRTNIKKPKEDDNFMIILLNDESGENNQPINTTEQVRQPNQEQGEQQEQIEGEGEREEEQQEQELEHAVSSYEASDGNTYSTEAIVRIPKINISYPVLSKNNDETVDELLEISVCKFFGGEPNEIGNYSIVGHNYRNGKMFGRLSELVNGDIVELEDLSGRTIKYEVYYIYVVEPTDTSCTDIRTNRKELTLITCTNYGTQRLVVKCKEI